MALAAVHAVALEFGGDGLVEGTPMAWWVNRPTVALGGQAGHIGVLAQERGPEPGATQAHIGARQVAVARSAPEVLAGLQAGQGGRAYDNVMLDQTKGTLLGPQPHQETTVGLVVFADVDKFGEITRPVDGLDYAGLEAGICAYYSHTFNRPGAKRLTVAVGILVAALV